MSAHLTLPNIELDSTQGSINLSTLAHDWLLLYFYPKDATPGCSTQAQQLSQYQHQFAELNTQILGVSRDSLASHARFVDKQQINFTLISDPEEKLCQHFAVIKEKNMYGKKVLGIERSSFIFYRGQLQQSFRKVKADGHATFLLEQIQQLQTA
jgi:peroxiredoxin Q/BCP